MLAGCRSHAGVSKNQGLLGGVPVARVPPTLGNFWKLPRRTETNFDRLTKGFEAVLLEFHKTMLASCGVPYSAS